jgi:hypothetical protein
MKDIMNVYFLQYLNFKRRVRKESKKLTFNFEFAKPSHLAEK